MITIGGGKTPFGFGAIVKNTDNETVTFKVLAEMYFAGEWHKFPADNYYGGEIEWTLDAKQDFSGSIGLSVLLGAWGIAALGAGAWLKLSVVDSAASSLWRSKGDAWIMEPDRSKAP